MNVNSWYPHNIMGSHYKIAVVGLWHLGEIYSVGLAELGHQVVGIDDNAATIENFTKNIPPLAESRLAELLAARQATGNLLYTTDFGAIKNCNVVWFTFDTPVNDEDEVDVSVVINAIDRSISHLESGVLIVVSSQLPVGTSEKIVAMIKAKRPELVFNYAYSPENLRLGDAVKCFLEPGRIVVGAAGDGALTNVKEIFSKLNAEIVSMSPASAEMAKHALNAYLATSISFTNDVADLCEQYGADVEAVVKALKSDPRIGLKAYLFAGLGFSGGTLGRDLKVMMKAGGERNIEVPVVESVFAKNKTRNALVEKRLIKEIGPLAGKTFSMFGVTYKAGTSTLRRSQPLEIEKSLREHGMTLKLYDPWAKPEEVTAATSSSFFNDPYAAAQGVHGILVMTPSRDFGNFDFRKLRAATKGNILFDTCNILCDKEGDIVDAGFRYIRIGRS